MFNVPSTARSFRDGTLIYCPLRRTWNIYIYGYFMYTFYSHPSSLSLLRAGLVSIIWAPLLRQPHINIMNVPFVPATRTTRHPHYPPPTLPALSVARTNRHLYYPPPTLPATHTTHTIRHPHYPPPALSATRTTRQQVNITHSLPCHFKEIQNYYCLFEKNLQALYFLSMKYFFCISDGYKTLM